MKNIIAVLCIAMACLAPSFSKAESFADFPWMYDHETDGWYKMTSGLSPTFVMTIKKDYTTDFLGNSILTGASFSILSECQEGLGLYMFSWNSMDDMATWNDCDHQEWEIPLNSFEHRAVCPLPEEIQNIPGSNLMCHS